MREPPLSVLSLQLLAAPCLPESPRWLLLHGKQAEAIAIATRLGTNMEISAQTPHNDNEIECCSPDEALNSWGSLSKPLIDNEDSDFVVYSASQQEQPSFSLLSQLWASRNVVLTACLVGCSQNVMCLNAALYVLPDLMMIGGICKPYHWGVGLAIMKVSECRWMRSCI